MDIEELLAEHGDKVTKGFETVTARLSALEDKSKAIEIKIARPGVGVAGAAGTLPEDIEHKAAFNAFLRKGAEDGLADLEAKALNIATPGDGGYALPREIDSQIASLLRNRNTIRSIASVVQVGSQDYRKLVNLHGAAASWVGESTARPTTATPELAEISPPIGELYANPSASQRALDDIFFDVEAWLLDELNEQFSITEGTAFVSGDGTNKPKGFLAGPTPVTTADGARAFGTLQMIKTGVGGGFTAVSSTTSPIDDLIACVMALRPDYRANGTWVMNGTTLERIRKFKDADGRFVWQPSAQAGQPSTLLGYPVLESADMPDVAVDTFPIAFGDFRRGYMVVDRVGTRILRDPFTNKPFTSFYATKRVGGSLIDTNAIKLLATRT